MILKNLVMKNTDILKFSIKMALAYCFIFFFMTIPTFAEETNTEYVMVNQLDEITLEEIVEMPSHQEIEAIEEVEEAAAVAAETARMEKIDAAVNFAYSKVGYPYSMARRDSQQAFDCSSLVYYSYLSAGVDLSNNGANTAAEMGRKYNNNQVPLDQIQKGDLVFYQKNVKNTPGSITGEMN